MRDIRFLMIPGAPEPVAPFSHATECDGWVFVTGQMPTVAGAPDAALADGIVAQTRQVMHNLRHVLQGLGLDLDDVVRTGAYLTHFERDYAAFNAEYRTWFASGRLPARTCIGVTALACDALVEIDFVARRPAA
ncbi:MAG: RidA family protein [Burkholderiales bacterium]|jgi:reactive intermediate/imine deaminase|nr:RidA family protein [Burkholderiales bacterium]